MNELKKEKEKKRKEKRKNYEKETRAGRCYWAGPHPRGSVRRPVHTDLVDI
jgi:hypothetical protein